ncbi:MAG: Cof-type HAD-IIB family hydrolase [Tannerella sp.]|jgi:Cof subfamily protein (haloacid dehalogenase superfamily)|nr:Cof-type HAD-IIB family hydrolase [Tannerella sp.]
MNRIKAIFFDIDGTLVSFRTHSVPLSALRALDSLRANGVKTFVATGRMLSMITALNGIPFDGYITNNGAYCVDASCQKVIYACPVPQEDLEALVDHLEKDPFPVAFMPSDVITVNCVNETVKQVACHLDTPLPRVEDPRLTIRKEIFQFSPYVNDEKTRYLEQYICPHCTASRWMPLFADVNVRGVSKQTGIDRMLDYYGLSLSETMAFGDGGNDIPMLKHVAVGVAMGNASEHVKVVADYTTTSVDEDGIYHALRHFGLIAPQTKN